MAIYALVAEFARREVTAIHAIAAFDKVFNVVTIFVVSREITKVNIFGSVDIIAKSAIFDRTA